jgi:hypothetical protein
MIVFNFEENIWPKMLVFVILSNMLYWTEIAPVFDFASGFDETGRKIVNICVSLIRQPLCYNYNHSLYTGNFPDRLEIAVIRPLYKKGDKISMINYRPISLLPVFGKVFEKTTHSSLRHNLHTNNILITE